MTMWGGQPCERIVPRLLDLVYHQRHPRRAIRRDAGEVFRAIDRLAAAGARPYLARGPWRAVRRPLHRPGRLRLPYIPTVERRGEPPVQICVDTLEQAERLAGFLNWCTAARDLPGEVAAWFARPRQRQAIADAVAWLFRPRG